MRILVRGAAALMLLAGTPAIAEDSAKPPAAAPATTAAAGSDTAAEAKGSAAPASPAPASAAAPRPGDAAAPAATPAAAEATPAAPAAPAAAEITPAAPAATPAAEPAKPAPPPPPPITLVLNTDLAKQRLSVIENGKVKYVWPISSGRHGFATPTGTFRPQRAHKMWFSRQYELAPMPHAVFFHRGTAFHGTGATGLLGQPASHGCVRLAPGNAAMLYKLVHKHSFVQTKVVVHHAGRRKGTVVADGRQPADRIAARAGGRGERATRARRDAWDGWDD